MGGQYTKEYTVNYVTQPCSKYCEVHLNGYDGLLILERNHTNYPTLFNKLRAGSTHEFTFTSWDCKIIDICDCKIHYTCGVVTDFIDMNIIYPKWSTGQYHQVLIDGFTEHNIIVNIEQKEQIKINETYMFHYSKTFGRNCYQVVKFLPTSEINC
jgi:hypothetical protein